MLSFAAVPAAADNPCLALDLSAPAECPSAEAIEQTVMDLVHTVPPAPLSARATITKQGERYTVIVVTAAGERTFDGETCQGAADALSVILALAVDPNSSTTPPGAPPDLAPAPQPAPPTAPVAPAPPVAPVVPVVPAREATAQPAPRAQTPLTLGASLLAFVDSGILPGVAGGAGGALRFISGVVSAELSAKYILPRSTTFESEPDVGGTFRWAGGGLDACLQVLEPLYSCFGFEVGGLIGQGEGVDTPFTRTEMMVALTGGAVARWQLVPGSALEGRLGVAVPMDRPVYGVEGFGALHQPDAVSIRLGLGVAFE
jgi:hypothetical protein